MGTIKKTLESTLNLAEVKSVLEVGVGIGDYFETLSECFGDHTKMVGVDVVQSYLDKSAERFKDRNADFHLMNGESLDFDDKTFDIVTISNSLHHVPEPNKVLSEMMRVLKPDGRLIIHEMIQDDPTSKQAIHVWMHHLNADIDMELGTHHAYTYERDELKSLLSELNLKTEVEVEYLLHNELDLGSETEVLDDVFSSLEKRISQIEDDSVRKSLLTRMEDNKDHCYNTGFELATEYFAILKTT